MSKWTQVVKLENVKMATDGKIGKMSKWTQNEIPNLVEVDVQFLLQLSQILLLGLGWKKNRTWTFSKKMPVNL